MRAFPYAQCMNWIGTILQIAGAYALAGQLLHPYWAYALMTPGAAILAARNFYVREFPQFLLMLAFIIIDVWGLATWAA